MTYAEEAMVAVKSTFQFDVSGPCHISYVIGVSDPSEFNYPMRPYTGVSYPEATPLILGPGESTSAHKSRLDIIDPGSMVGADYRSWQMNPGNQPYTGRGYPSLVGLVTNNGSTPVTITNIQLLGEASQK
jgi:hypothetical protein